MPEPHALVKELKEAPEFNHKTIKKEDLKNEHFNPTLLFWELKHLANEKDVLTKVAEKLDSVKDAGELCRKLSKLDANMLQNVSNLHELDIQLRRLPAENK